jgi:hypothetical protein
LIEKQTELPRAKHVIICNSWRKLGNRFSKILKESNLKALFLDPYLSKNVLSEADAVLLKYGPGEKDWQRIKTHRNERKQVNFRAEWRDLVGKLGLIVGDEISLTWTERRIQHNGKVLDELELCFSRRLE